MPSEEVKEAYEAGKDKMREALKTEILRQLFAYLFIERTRDKEPWAITWFPEKDDPSKGHASLTKQVKNSLKIYIEGVPGKDRFDMLMKLLYALGRYVGSNGMSQAAEGSKGPVDPFSDKARVKDADDGYASDKATIATRPPTPAPGDSRKKKGGAAR